MHNSLGIWLRQKEETLNSINQTDEYEVVLLASVVDIFLA